MKREINIPMLCKFAFKNEQQLKETLPKYGFKFIEFYDSPSMQAYLCECDEGKVLVFRASELDINDWILNFKFWLKDTEIGSVHSGYYDILDENYDKLSKFIDDDTLIVGWSQGAGLACIFNKMLRVRNNIDTLYVAIEPPKVSDDVDFNDNGWYTVNGEDIVPRLPLLLMGYRHTGVLLYFSKKGKLYINPRHLLRFLDALSDSINKDLLDNLADFIDDHKIEAIEQNWYSNWFKLEKELCV